MKQAIEEGFIKDVLGNYTTYQSYYKILITKDGQEEYSKKQANKQLRRYVESHVHTIEEKARVMLDHFYNQVYLKGLVGGKAKAMVVCSSRVNAAKYHFSFKKVIQENNYPLAVITAFSGDVELDGIVLSEPKLNGFSSSLIADEFDSGSYQILICANKFQTGFDQPLLQTMYVDKKLGGVNAVQTLSRLNRTHPEKGEVFVLDFFNSEDDIKAAFEPYYQTTILSSASDPNKLNDLKDSLDGFGVYGEYVVKKFASDILTGKKIELLHSMLDSVVNNIKQLPTDQIDDFKDRSNSYVRFYGFIAQILPYDIVEFEELYQFLKVLNKKIGILGSKETLIASDILDSIEFDSYRNQKVTSNARISLSQANDLESVPTTIKGVLSNDPKDIIQNIVKEFNERFHTNFKDEDKVKKMILDLSDDIVADKRVTNSLQDSDRSNRMLVLQKLLDEKMTENVDNHMELFNNYHDNQDFRAHLVKYVDRIVTEKLKDLI